MKKLYLILFTIGLGFVSGLILEVAAMGDESKLLYFTNTGIIEERWIPFTSSETSSKELALEKNFIAEFSNFSIIKNAYLAETIPEALLHLAIALDVDPIIFDPDDDPTNENNYFINEVNECTFHTESDIPNLSCVICLLGDSQYVIGKGQHDLDSDIGYVGSSVLSIPITDPQSPDPALDITNVMSVAIDFCTQGCTPGYWKQPQHSDSWVTYSPNQSFESVFGDDSFNTLLDALEANGGQINALGRHAVAALLNAATSGVFYDFTEQEVIDQYNLAIANENYEEIKDIFETQNELGCPLN